MKIVLDTTEFVSGSFWGGPSRSVIQRVSDGLDTMYITNEIIEEAERVILRSKFRHSDEIKERAIAKIKEIGTKIIVRPEHRVRIDACRDPKDIMYLECAVAAKADCIVSGDSDLRVLKEYSGIRILNAKDYLDMAARLTVPSPPRPSP